MGATRFALRVLFRIERVLDRLNLLLSAVYVSLVVGLISVTSYVYWTNLYTLVSQTLPKPLAHVHTAFSLYLIFAVVSNYVRCLLTSPGSPSCSVDVESHVTMHADEHGYDCTMTRSESWRYCTICRGPKPPRTHHCSVCKACYYRLCHHCPALGKCVGRDNYPFFWRFVMASWWGALFTAATCAYLRRMGMANTRETDEVLFFMTIGGCAVGVAVGVLGVWHSFLVMTGQTTIEWLENIQMRRQGTVPEEWGRWGGAFNKGISENFREVFGEMKPFAWWTLLFCPIKRIAKKEELQ